MAEKWGKMTLLKGCSLGKPRPVTISQAGLEPSLTYIPVADFFFREKDSGLHRTQDARGWRWERRCLELTAWVGLRTQQEKTAGRAGCGEAFV